MSKSDEVQLIDPAGEPLWLIASALALIRFGVIQLTVHDGHVTQVDVTERQRFGTT